MKLNFSRRKVYVPVFNSNTELPEDEQLRFRMRSMSMGDFAIALEHVREVKEVKKVMEQAAGSAPEEPETVKERGALVDLFADVLPRYVESVGAPLKTSDDAELSIKEIATDAPLMSLASELFWELFLYSRPAETDLKN